MSSLDWAYHVRRADVPPDASKDALHAFIGGLFAEQMDVSKPLWQFYVVESLQADGGIRAAVVPRVHHVLGDGTSLVHPPRRSGPRHRYAPHTNGHRQAEAAA